MTGLAASSCEARNTKGVMPACRILAGMLAAMVMKMSVSRVIHQRGKEVGDSEERRESCFV